MTGEAGRGKARRGFFRRGWWFRARLPDGGLERGQSRFGFTWEDVVIRRVLSRLAAWLVPPGPDPCDELSELSDEDRRYLKWWLRS